MSTTRFFVHLWRLVVFVSIITIVAAIAIWSLDDRPPITFISAVAESHDVMQGGTLHVDYRVIQRRQCPGDLQRWIVDSRNVIHFIELYAAAPEIAGISNVRVSIPIPLGASLGPARYQAILHYRCNPLQRLIGWSVDVMTPPINFTILPVPTQQSLSNTSND